MLLILMAVIVLVEIVENVPIPELIVPELMVKKVGAT
jgi:hypothetical protein